MQTKKCTGCLSELDLSLFSKDAQSPDGKSRRCRSCRSNYNRQRLADPVAGERARASKRKHYALNLEAVRARRQANLAKEKARAAAYYLKNKEIISIKNRTWRLANLDKCRLAQAKYRSENREKTRASVRQSMAKAVGKNNARKAKYRIEKLLRVPAWLCSAERLQIRELYEKAREMTEETGRPHHVDHIFPLLGEFVSGLHVFANLQILPAKANLRKNNKWVPR